MMISPITRREFFVNSVDQLNAGWALDSMNDEGYILVCRDHTERYNDIHISNNPHERRDKATLPRITECIKVSSVH